MAFAIPTASAPPSASLTESLSGDPFLAAAGNLKSLCGGSLDRVDAAILDALHSPVEMIPKVAGHLMQAGGKRLRPLLTISAADLFGYDGNDHIKLAAAVELIHGATLLHDDVVDESALRRGLSTANLIWGDKESVLVGDFLFSRSFELMVSTGKLSVLDILSRASGVIAEGEVLQLGTQKNIETSFDDYLKVIDAKTAALFAAAAEVGATVAEAGEEACNAMRSFGRHLGLAFQLVDDALDYSGVETSLGKNVGDDFREGKMTAPIVFAISKATPTQKDFWKRTISDGNQREDDFLQAMSIVLETGAIAETLSTASYHASKALDALKLAPAGKVRDTLEALARVSVHRGQ